MSIIRDRRAVIARLRTEWPFVAALITLAVFAIGDRALDERLADPVWLVVQLVWLFAAVLAAAFRVVHYAETLAVRIGEPLGTLVLTIAVTLIEVTTIGAAMMHGDNNPTFARDTIFAAVMLIMNGMIGLSLVVGGWRHREQQHNLQGAHVFLSVIVPLVVLNLVLPAIVDSQHLSLSFDERLFVTVASLGLYGAFLAVQTGRHRGYFRADETGDTPHRDDVGVSTAGLMGMLLLYLVPGLLLAERLSHPIDYMADELHVPGAITGVILAALVATPEAIGAVRAARANQLQRSINISLGSLLSTIGMTVPATVVVSWFSRRPITLGLSTVDAALLILSLSMSVVTFSTGRTNIIQGIVHLILFATYLLFSFGV